jgi:hypothetical protein
MRLIWYIIIYSISVVGWDIMLQAGEIAGSIPDEVIGFFFQLI